MIYLYELEKLVSTWTERASHPFFGAGYADGLRDCAYELTQLINHAIEEETMTDELYQEKLADDYLLLERENGIAV
jgi:hypothetical protein